MSIEREARLVVGFKLNHQKLLEALKPILINSNVWNDHDTAGSVSQLAGTKLFNIAIDHMRIVAFDFDSEFPFLSQHNNDVEYYSDDNGTEFGISLNYSDSPEKIIKLINYSKKALYHLFVIYNCAHDFDENLIKVFPVIYSY